MKKILCATIALTLSIGLCSCALRDTKPESTKTKTATTTVTTAAAETSQADTAVTTTAATTKKPETTTTVTTSSAKKPETTTAAKKIMDGSEGLEEYGEFEDYISVIEDMSKEEIEIVQGKDIVDKTIYPDLQNVLDKYGIDISYLISLSGVSEDVFFYNWNNCNNAQLKSNVEKFLFGSNFFVCGDQTHLRSENQVTIKPLLASWDLDGSLHVFCSVKNGFKDFAYNVSVGNMEVYTNGSLIASKSFGYITDHVEDIRTSSGTQVISYDGELYYDFEFEQDHILQPYANIMNDLDLAYTVANDYYSQH